MVAATLRSEIQSLIDATGWVPRVLVLHLFPQTEADVRRDIDELRAETGWDIGIGRAGQMVSI